ncbi:MAG: peptidyl-tRNA hydrolase [Planctomycetes bacterium]|nr:peptidyl-tRNA hydrolase [Planctomycetota bacterium]MCB9910880.1 peptidyl-tRNA hydrolase [Planctomycetota bacterium]MCB9912091.1 peptidyl-tRNA hydrolase [Planctomycetota bacterium]HPF14592.1 aminoacyl-tRNA hydrolase [Planctomycetota bacterium]HRV80536.1 aminoacyl-tRNA hydrolase [Planctomycetota bacterium]
MTDALPGRLVVGLGNPGPEYDWTRHNLGFHVVDRVAEIEGQLFQSASKLPGYTGPKSFEWAGLSKWHAWLVKPMTFMNRSGKVVGPLAQKLLALSESAAEPLLAGEPEPTFDPSRLLVVYDDLDLDLGRLRLRPHGGHGGHNGMRSIIEHLGTNRFPRLRVGIGSPGTDAVRHVLETFPTPQRVEAEISVQQAAEAILDWLQHGDFEKCMTRFHSRWNGES